MLASVADTALLDREAKVVMQELEPQSVGGVLVAFVKVAVGHAKAARSNKLPSAEQAETDLEAAAPRRR
jgi:hypothetical protein